MFETLMAMLRTLEDVGDVTLWVNENGSVEVTFEDFDGFDDNWDEVMRDYELPELVDKVLNLLDQCDHEGDFYVTYLVDGHRIEVGYGSYDI